MKGSKPDTSVSSRIYSSWADGLPDSLFDLIFRLLNGHDLLRCRRVCKLWETFCSPLLFDKTQLTFDGTKRLRVSKWLSSLFCIITPDKRFVSLIQNNPRWLSGWSDLSIRNTEDSDLTTIFTLLSPDLQKQIFENIGSLELSNCTLSWGCLLRLLEMLENLRSFTDCGTFLAFDSATSLCLKSFNQLQEDILEKYASFRFDLTKVRITRGDVGIKTLIYLKLLEKSCLNLEDLQLNIEASVFSFYHEANRRFDYSSVVGLLLLKHAATLKRLSFEWTGQFLFHFVEDFYRSLSILSWSNSNLLLTHVNLHFDFLFVGNPSFQEILGLFIFKLDHLKVLSIKKILFQSEWTGLLLSIQPQEFERLQTKISFGILLSDHPDLEFATRNIAAIRRQSILCGRLGFIRVAISSPLTQRLSQILPITWDASFPNAKELIVNHIHCHLFPSHFVDFNIDGICEAFQNLTQLTILDGARFSYRGRFRIKRQYEKMTPASVKNQDMQLILGTLTKLQRLRLRLRMEELTDVGTTGLSPVACSRLHQSVDIKTQRLEDKDRIGFCFSNLNGFGYKECLADGTWFKHPATNHTWSNYTTCVDVDEYQWRRFIVSLNELGYIISILALISSLLIFCSFKCLECTRVRIHKHLFISFILSNLLWLAWYRIVTFNEYVLIMEPWWCKGLHVLVQYFLMANYFWMFCEGFYLHTLLVFAFIRSDSQLLTGFYIFGWLGPLIPIAVYTVLRIRDSQEDHVTCWTSESKWSLLIAVPVCVSLLLNLGFLINIVRVLVKKLNDSDRSFTNIRRNSSIIASDSHYSLKKAVRATFILIPLLGLHYLLIPIRPKGTNWEAVYDVVSAAAASLQGFCVSFLFCFCNSEVLIVIRRRMLSRLCQNKSLSPGHRDDNNSGPLPTTRGYPTSGGVNNGSLNDKDQALNDRDASSPISLEMQIVEVIQHKG